jgi:hypothetical protein
MGKEGTRKKPKTRNAVEKKANDPIGTLAF